MVNERVSKKRMESKCDKTGLRCVWLNKKIEVNELPELLGERRTKRFVDEKDEME